jgi:glycine hydroxymethyltransferase
MKELNFFDPEVYDSINREDNRQKNSIELIASENFASQAVMQAQGSVLTNKYAEGYPAKRYYSGCEYVDEVEILAIERLKKLFACSYANVQPHSGSGANQAAFLSLLHPGETILAMDLNAGGHLTHGAKVNLSGKWFNFHHYSVHPDTYLIDYDDVERLAIKCQPKLIIVGYSAYSRILDFAKFKQIADKVGAYLMADIAHIAGLVATGHHPSPLNYADIVTSTTHKTLRGPRGGIMLSNNEDLSKKFNSAIFPGLQGGPLMHVIAAKAVAFKEALQDDFKVYIESVIKNAQILSSTLMSRGYEILTGGTDNHMILVDLRKTSITGKVAADKLHEIGITCNKNNIPFDCASPFVTSGIRLGSPACTTRGMQVEEFKLIGNLIADVLDNIDDLKILDKTKHEVIDLCKKFPIYT